MSNETFKILINDDDVCDLKSGKSKDGGIICSAPRTPSCKDPFLLELLEEYIIRKFPSHLVLILSKKTKDFESESY